MQDEIDDDIDKYFSSSNAEKNDLPIIRVLDDSGSLLP